MQIGFYLRPAAAVFGAGRRSASFSSHHLFFSASRATVAFQLPFSYFGTAGLISSPSPVAQALPRAFCSTAREVSAGTTGSSVWSSRRFHSSLSSGAARDMSTSGKQSTGSLSEGVKDLKTAEDVMSFWFGDESRLQAHDEEYLEERNRKWWGFGPPDQDFVDTQMAAKGLMEQAANDELKSGDWEGPRGALARVLLLDQFPRTVYRGTPKAFGTDEKASKLAVEIITKGWDKLGGELFPFHRTFLNMPLMHSELLSSQELSVQKSQELYDEQVAAGHKMTPLDIAFDHRDVIAKFGRFPHRNTALGRKSTPEELEWLNSDDLPGWAKSQQTT